MQWSTQPFCLDSLRQSMIVEAVPVLFARPDPMRQEWGWNYKGRVVVVVTCVGDHKGLCDSNN